MGCNAWNHPANCPCGFRGGHGYGTGRATYVPQVQVHVSRPRSGADWSIRTGTTYAEYVNPNARCPVCKGQVYFIAFENGSRVFFNHLGWPWPKHSCTDRKNLAHDPDLRLISFNDHGIGLSEKASAEAAAKGVPDNRNPSQPPWRPLIFEHGSVQGKQALFKRRKPEPYLPGDVLTFESAFDPASPLFWRPVLLFPGLIEIEGLAAGGNGGGHRVVQARGISWASSFGDVETYQDAIRGDHKARFSIAEQFFRNASYALERSENLGAALTLYEISSKSLVEAELRICEILIQARHLQRESEGIKRLEKLVLKGNRMALSLAKQLGLYGMLSRYRKRVS